MKLNNNDDSHNSGLNLLIYNMLLDIESHPAWVCGLKLLVGKARTHGLHYLVTNKVFGCDQLDTFELALMLFFDNVENQIVSFHFFL